MSTAAQEPRTASVRDLRNRFADVAKWIEDGEQVSITRNGKSFATLSPAQPVKPKKADWAARFKKRPLLGRKLNQAETKAFYDVMKGRL